MADEEKVPMEESEEKPLKITRRDFLVGASAGVVVTGAAAAGISALRGPEIQEVEVPVEVVKEVEVIREVEVPMEVVVEELLTTKPVNLTINGLQYSIDVDVRWTLKDLLREHLHLTGTKTGCNVGTCGFCTVLVNDRNIYSCSVLAASLDNADVVTIEGLARGTTLHPVQQAYWENMGFQCAMCTPGFIMSSVALLNLNPDPTLAEVKEGLAGNLCRCGSYPKAFQSVLAAAQAMKEA